MIFGNQLIKNEKTHISILLPKNQTRALQNVNNIRSTYTIGSKNIHLGRLAGWYYHFFYNIL